MVDMTDNPFYEERISSNRTEALFSGFTILFFVLLVWRLSTGGLDILSAALFFIFVFFLFYSVNYRKLINRLTPETFLPKSGSFTWAIPLVNIAECRLDDLQMLMRNGGTG